MKEPVGRHKTWRHWLLGAAGLGALVSVGFAGCALDRSGTIPRDCTVDTQCDDQNPCTVDVCSDNGLCGHEPNDDVALPQVEGDCRYASCEDGEPVDVSDTADFSDDGESCTVDSCQNGQDTHAPRADGAGCTVGANSGTCAAGKCQVECTAADKPAKCDDQNPCTEDSCNLGAGYCAHVPLDGVSPAAGEQVKGDCRVKVCLAGKVGEAAENSDLPEDQNPCTANVCSEGMASNPNQPLDFACSAQDDPLKKVCNDAGTCVQCNTPNACHPAIDFVQGDDLKKAHPECYKRACNANVCGWEYTPDGTPLSLNAKVDKVDGLTGAYTQVKGDCKELQCDGKGLTKLVNLPNTGVTADLPDDLNVCTKNVCTDGVPSNPAEPAVVTTCGANNALYCDGNGSCVDCVGDAQCPDDSTFFCRDDFCDVATKTCKVKAKKPAGTPVPQQVAGDCREVQCTAMGGTINAVKNTDLPDDNKQCTKNVCTNGTPSNPNEAAGLACTQDMGKVCDGAGACVECNAVSVASNCPAAVDCQSPSCVMGKCTVVNDPATSDCDSQVLGDCKTKRCTGMGACNAVGVANDLDVPNDNNACTTDTCSMGVTVFSPKASNTQVVGSCDNATGCANGPCACDASVCKSRNGGMCANGTTCVSGFCADGFCCNTSCTGACAACATAKGAVTNGTCAAAAVKGAQDAGSCDDAAGMCDGTDKCTCDAVGACKVKIGEACLANAECASGFCADGFCCNAACTGACSACSLATGATANGTCTANAVKGMTDAGACDAAAGNCNGMQPCVCDAAGACKVALGKACTMGSQCASGFCADGVCCNAACNGGCDACSVAAGAAVDGTCSVDAVTNATDAGACDAVTASESCVGPPCMCDMNGTCKGDLGSMTTNAADCLSGFSADGVCCNEACTGTCARCDSMSGMCMAKAVMNMVDPMTCDAMNGNCGANSGCSCNAMGMCLLAQGGSCAMAGQCASGTCTNGTCE
ncbi:MAG: hypothetical protein FJ095_02630 [Deltaproteobacteria bacterium]|nr:hypothetical protein [Deltaproteobacteria bacterium]